ncbi:MULTISPECIES: type II toxin-antitoxin system RelE/ParE family toxin [Dyadobacter]|jgi:phage-related protein|uniref:Type II toxin-antitoxin system RelE/ParE family toxin n=1 Tax=Dyadobacter chenhuakuii TaxID=2909339 RepID=A0A9X1Q9Q7_9BACT|nr:MULTISPECIES: type II toxin-antitoxin system RelE/ParE family toxin [Dyadobacter]MCF2497069.1 type II toxin-antitoxin system RelE/ParE family toxin [Dyadobacter chenhuakuii]MCF2520462.1 type II toxin-antitoxin system RelE/ParE family toxin [Dyadobacter sp. CY351]
MTKIRKVIGYKHYFEEFVERQSPKVKEKIYGVLLAIETLERIPASFLKQIQGSNGLYEARIQLGSNIWRVFCFFDQDRLVILLNGFQKKTQKTPRREIERAIRLMDEYYHTK